MLLVYGFNFNGNAFSNKENLDISYIIYFNKVIMNVKSIVRKNVSLILRLAEFGMKLLLVNNN